MPVIDSALQTMVSKLVESWPVERIILFGSRARGDNLADSDYDLLVLIPDEKYYQGMSVDMRGTIDRVPVSRI